jgi:hypothetical protein
MFNAAENPARGAIYLREDQAPEMRLFGELARDRGVPFRVFADRPEALNWPLSEED